MSRIATFAVRTALSLILALFTTSALEARQAGSLKEQVKAAVARMEGARLGEVFTIADNLVALGEGVIPLVKEELKALDDPHAMLGCLRVLTSLESSAESANKLLELAGPDQDSEIRIAALSEIRNIADSINNDSAQSKIAAYLDDALDPDVKCALAQALYDVGDGSQRKRALNDLKQLLKSDDRALRVKGAFALAKLGDMDSAGPILRPLAEEPTIEGALARSLIDNDDLLKYYTSREERLVREGAVQGGKNNTSDRFALLQEIIERIQADHIYGEKYQGADGQAKLIDAAAKGMLQYLDPHSTYFSAAEYEKWLLDLNRDYGGIGAYVNTVGGWFTITRPIYTGPAFKAGLRSDDQIWAVDGWDTYGKPQQDVIDRLKGKPGTGVRVKVYRAGWKEPRDFDLTRATIDIPSVRAELFPGGIGYVEVQTFGEDTTRELRVALNDLQNRGMKGMVLDLRYNPGGYLNEAVEMCGEFIGGNKLVVECRHRGEEPGQGIAYSTRKNAKGRDLPLIVLINHSSASASEIVSGTLKHYGRATLIGKKSYGKGSVQNPFLLETQQAEPFDDRNRNGRFDPSEEYTDVNKNGKYDYGGMIKITTQRYYLPGGESIHTDIDADGRVLHAGGVAPDIEADFEGVSPWKQEELADLLKAEESPEDATADPKSKTPSRNVFEKYIEKHFPGNEALFVSLAEGDGGSTDRYPEFEAFYTSLNTHLDKNEIRRWLRLYIRQKVADVRQKEFPGNDFLGDFEEDTQLQRAIVELMKKMGQDIAQEPAYRAFVDIAAKQDAVVAERKRKEAAQATAAGSTEKAPDEKK